MQLKLKRSQRSAGLMGGKVVFALDAQVDFSPDEAALVKKYGLASQTIYDSEARKKHAGTVRDYAEGRSGFLSGAAAFAMSSLSLHVTVDGLSRGQHIEAKSLDELIGAEEAIREACGIIKNYLAVATTFDGREEVIDF
jgi:hypothetical protein